MVYRLRLQSPILPETKAAIEAFPGVRVFGHPTIDPSGARDWSGQPKSIYDKAVVQTPHNAAWLVDAVLRGKGVHYKVTSQKEPEWKAHARLAVAGRGDVAPLSIPGTLPWVPSFLTPYQRDFVTKFADAESALLLWAPGCLAGDTVVAVNRAGRSKSMPIKRLVGMFNGNYKNRHGKAWRLDIPTRVQSRDPEGFIRLCTVEAAVCSGVKPVFCLRTASGKSIRATADHRFLTEELGIPVWRKLAELRAGARVFTASWPTQGERETRPKAYYREVQHMWNHPYAVRRYATRQRRGRRMAFVWEHRLVAEAQINGLDFDTFVGRIVLDRVDGLKFIDPAVFHVHHKNHDTTDNSPENLEVLTIIEHLARHGRESAWKNCAGITTPDVIVSIEAYGEEETFDLTLRDAGNENATGVPSATDEPNFIANEFVVHNSGKTLAFILWSTLAPGLSVIVTRAGARTTIAREISRFTTAPAIIVEGEDAEKAVVLPSADLPKLGWPRVSLARAIALLAPRFVIVSWESLPYHVKELIELNPATVVFDECHRGKGRGRWNKVPLPTGAELDPTSAAALRTQQVATAKAQNGYVKDDWASGTLTRTMIIPNDTGTAAAMRLSKAATRRCGATGSPVMDRLQDLWAQLDLIDPFGFGGFKDFATRYLDGKTGEWGELIATGRTNIEELVGRLAYVAHHVPKEVTHRYLPPKRREMHVLPSTVLGKGSMTVAELKAAAANGAMALFHARLMEAASRKRPWIVENVAEWVDAGKKVLVFTGRRQDVDLTAAAVRAKFRARIDRGEVAVWSGMGGDDGLQAACDAYWQWNTAKGGCVLVGTAEAFGESLNGMQDTDEFIIAMLPWSPGKLEQWEGRATRLGQRRPVRFHYPIAEGTVEERVAGVLLEKLPDVVAITGDRDVGAFARLLETGGKTPEQLDAEMLTMLREAGDALTDL